MIQHLQYHQNQIKITITLTQLVMVSDKPFCEIVNLGLESQSYHVFYNNDKNNIYSRKVFSLTNLICNMFEFLDFKSLTQYLKAYVNWMYDSYDLPAICFLNLCEYIAKAKQQDSNHLIGMENDDEDESLKNATKTVNYVDAANSVHVKRFKNSEGIDMKN